MYYSLRRLLTLSLFNLGMLGATAQTIATFDDLPLPGPDTFHIDLSADLTYFQNGGGRFESKWESVGGYIMGEGFTYSNVSTTVLKDSFDMRYQYAASTGSGYTGSSTYAVGYAYNPAKIILDPLAARNPVAGFYLANSAWAYGYALEKYGTDTTGWARLSIKGWRQGNFTPDSVVVYLADFRNPAKDTPILTGWNWVDLAGLGKVDSLSFQVTSSNDFFPSYFCMDHFTTSDKTCPLPDDLALKQLTPVSVTLQWSQPADGGSPQYEIAVDETPTLAPTASAILVSAREHEFTLLQPNTQYYAHIRTQCADGQFSAWDTLAFETPVATGLSALNSQDNGVSLYPNPATHELNLRTAKPMDVTVYTLSGQQLFSEKQTRKIKVSHLPEGLYLVKVMNPADGQVHTLRFAKKD